jgi:hypothetical protein
MRKTIDEVVFEALDWREVYVVEVIGPSAREQAPIKADPALVLDLEFDDVTLVCPPPAHLLEVLCEEPRP